MNVLYENCSPRLIFRSFSFRSTKIWHGKLTLNLENLQFLRALTQKVLKGIKKSLEYAYWVIKMCRILLDIL